MGRVAPGLFGAARLGLVRFGPGWPGLDWMGLGWAGWAVMLGWVRLGRLGLAKPKRMGWALSPVGLLGLAGVGFEPACAWARLFSRRAHAPSRLFKPGAAARAEKAERRMGL